jgi:hypothetical protein
MGVGKSNGSLNNKVEDRAADKANGTAATVNVALNKETGAISPL